MLWRWIRGSRGLQTLEWVAIGLVILALVGAVAFWITYRASESTGRTVGETIAYFFECVQRMDLDCVRGGLGEPGAQESPRDLWWCITHPVECGKEVVWPVIQRGARAFWEGVKWLGRQIAEAGRRAWAWVVQQWNTWLKGAVAGLLAAIVVIGLIALAVLGGLITLPVAVIAGILVLVATIGVGIWQQMQGKGFWECFGSALMVGFLVAAFVISLSVALKWAVGAWGTRVAMTTRAATSATGMALRSPAEARTILWLEEEFTRVKHIMAPKHAWDRLINLSGNALQDYRAIQPFLQQVIESGSKPEVIGMTRQGQRILQFVGKIKGETVVVRVIELSENLYKISNAFVKTLS